MAGIGAIENLMDKLEAQQKHRFGTTRYVNSSTGMDVSSGAHGLTPSNPFLTIAAAVAMSAAGDTIKIRGSFTEAVVCSLAGLRFIGDGNHPCEATWTGDADAKCLTISAENVLVENIKFRPPAYSASRATCAIYLTESSGNYAVIRKNRFQGRGGSQAAIGAGPTGNVVIEDNEFIYMNTLTYGCGILGTATTGKAFSGWRILNNTFNSCVTGIDIDARNCEVVGNKIAEYGIPAAGGLGAVLAMGIDLSGTDTGANIVTQNQLGGTYSATLYVVGTAGDQWAGNYNVFAGTAGLCLTAANPAN